MQSWTIYYWAWWISWAPFVGTFIARISKGRTIREFVLGVILLPSAVSMVWFVIFGGTAIHLALTKATEIVSAVEVSQESVLFALLDQFPLAQINAVIVMVLIVLWFVSGALQAFVLPLQATFALVVPADMRGRVIGLAGAASMTTSALGFLLAGWLSDTLTPRASLAVCAALSLVGTALLAASSGSQASLARSSSRCPSPSYQRSTNASWTRVTPCAAAASRCRMSNAYSNVPAPSAACAFATAPASSGLSQHWT